MRILAARRGLDLELREPGVVGKELAHVVDDLDRRRAPLGRPVVQHGGAPAAADGRPRR